MIPLSKALTGAVLKKRPSSAGGLSAKKEKAIKLIYDRLYGRYGPQGWWPAQTRVEMIVGAVLTQNTSWSNVEKAIKNLKRSGSMSHGRILKMDEKKLASLIKPSGYYNLKARRLRNVIKLFAGDRRFRKGSALDIGRLREVLLSINGVGPETCDSILLYAFDMPVFVIDAYTRRIFSRHGVASHDLPYGDLQRVFMQALPVDCKIFNEYHALIVRLAKEHCRKLPRCAACPLNKKELFFKK